MKTLLDALQEGRLIELPDNHKNRALEYLAALIEAIPDIGVADGITETVLSREQVHNTGIGMGWACPHARSRRDGEVVCAVCWSPQGIDYGALDGAPVHIVVMYFVPGPQKNAYLKEISSLAKAIQTQPVLQNTQSLTDLGQVRHALLDAISAVMESTPPEAKARMIQLEARHAAVQHIVSELPEEVARSLTPLMVVVVPGERPVILSQDREVVMALEADERLSADLAQQGCAEHQSFHVLVRTSQNYQPNRVVYDRLSYRGNAGT